MENADNFQEMMESAIIDKLITQANKRIDNAADALKHNLMELRKECALLDRLADLVSEYLDELTLLISAADKKIQLIQDTKMIELNEKMVNDKSGEAVVNLRAIMDFINLTNKRISDITTSKLVAAQTSQIIRNIRLNDSMLADKIQSLCVNTLPAWKSQIYSFKNNSQLQNYTLVSNTNEIIISVIGKLI